MIDAVQVLWTPAGVSLSSLGTELLIDITDGRRCPWRTPTRRCLPKLQRAGLPEAPFDTNGRLLAYLAPNYSAAERNEMTREQRSTFNLDMVRAGWAVPFVLYPAIPGELDFTPAPGGCDRGRRPGRSAGDLG